MQRMTKFLGWFDSRMSRGRGALLVAPVLLIGLVSAAPAYAATPPATPSATSAATPTPAHRRHTQSVGHAAARIALSQVGVGDTPVSRSFGFDCDPYTTLVGPDIPNSNGCGVDSQFKVQNENEAWCSDFAKWVWEQAGVATDMNLINAGSNSFYAWGQAEGEALTVDSTTPQVGDAVVFFSPGTISATKYADHVGIVTAVNADGTVNLVDGDFRGSTNIGVELDSNVNLAAWASAVWNQGEQWVFVTPPNSLQQPAPRVMSLSGPSQAVANTAVTFSARAFQSQHGKISQYLWAFGDGGHATGARVSHVFGGSGLHTVALTVTSSLGTVTTKTLNVSVAATSSTVVSTPSVANWYSVTPVYQRTFSEDTAGGLAMNLWNGSEGSYQSLPGKLAASSGLTVLNYADTADDSMQAHAYYRSAGGQLAETYEQAGTWLTATLAGQPAQSSQIVATTQVGCLPGQRWADHTASGATPSVYYFDQSGRLAVSYATASGWSSATLPVAPTSHRALALAQFTNGGRLQEELFYVDQRGELVATSSVGCGGWRTTQVSSSAGVSPTTSLSAIAVGAEQSQTQVFFASRHGELAEATPAHWNRWRTQQVGHGSKVTGTIVSTTNLLTSGALGEDVFYLGSSGHPVHASLGSKGWNSETLSATATGIAGVGDFPSYIPPGEVNLPQPTVTVGRQPEMLYLSGTQREL